MIETYGNCIYCGQSQVIRVPEDADEGEKNREATKQCTCGDAQQFKNIEQSIDIAESIIKTEYASDPAAQDLLMTAARPVAENLLDRLTVKHNTVTYKLMRKADGTLKIEKETKRVEVKEA